MLVSAVEPSVFLLRFISLRGLLQLANQICSHLVRLTVLGDFEVSRLRMQELEIQSDLVARQFDEVQLWSWVGSVF